MHRKSHHYFFFFFNDTATTEIYTLSLHDALPISRDTHYQRKIEWVRRLLEPHDGTAGGAESDRDLRSEEHTSELQSQSNLVCRLLLEKKKKNSQMRVRANSDTTVHGVTVIHQVSA